MDYYSYGSALAQNWPEDAVRDIMAFMDWVGNGCNGDCPGTVGYIYDSAFEADMDTLECSGLENVEYRICGPGDGRKYNGALLLYSPDMFQANEVCTVLEAVAERYGILPDRCAIVGSSTYANACLPDDTLMPTFGGAVYVSCLGRHDPCGVMAAPFLHHCLQDWAEQALDGDSDKMGLLLAACEDYVTDAWINGGDIDLMRDICDFTQDARLTPERADMPERQLSWLKQASALALQHEETMQREREKTMETLLDIEKEKNEHDADQQ